MFGEVFGRCLEDTPNQNKQCNVLKQVLMHIHPTVETYDKKSHLSAPESGNFLFLEQISGF